MIKMLILVHFIRRKEEQKKALRLYFQHICFHMECKIKIMMKY